MASVHKLTYTHKHVCALVFQSLHVLTKKLWNIRQDSFYEVYKITFGLSNCKTILLHLFGVTLHHHSYPLPSSLHTSLHRCSVFHVYHNYQYYGWQTNRQYKTQIHKYLHVSIHIFEHMRRKQDKRGTCAYIHTSIHMRHNHRSRVKSRKQRVKLRKRNVNKE